MERTMIQPLHDRVVLRRLDADTVSAGGIHIPDAAQERPVRGRVVAVGEGRRDADGKRIPLDVKRGDIVLFGKYGGTEVKLDGEDCLIIREEEILAIVPT